METPYLHIYHMIDHKSPPPSPEGELMETGGSEKLWESRRPPAFA